MPDTNPASGDSARLYSLRRNDGLAPGLGDAPRRSVERARRYASRPDIFISAVVTVYNVPAKLLRDCLDSVVRQTLRAHEFELLVVDDCSTDPETIEVLAEFSKARPDVRTLRHDSNRGPGEARLTGFKASSGNYIVFVDGDDMLARDALQSLRIEAANKQADIVTASFLRWHSESFTYSDLPINGDPLPADYVKRLEAILSAQTSYTMCGRLFHREVLSNGVLELSLRHVHEDVATSARTLFKARSTAHVKQPLYYYTVNSGSITKNFTRRHAEGMLASIKDWISCARQANLFIRLSPAIAVGAEKLLSMCVERCAFGSALSEGEKVEVLDFIKAELSSLPIDFATPSASGMRLLANLTMDELKARPERLSEELNRFYQKGPPSHTRAQVALKYGLGPSEMACRLRNKVVFIAQVNYHVRNALELARSLRDHGHSCVILDNSSVVAAGKRKYLPQQPEPFVGMDYMRVEQAPYPVDWLATAKLIVTYNDDNRETREALEYRHRLALPTIGVIEGINDFLRVDFPTYRSLPYRCCDYVFLAGEDDEQYFKDRQTRIIGLPIIETLSAKTPTFPKTPLAVLNVNFTYGSLEDCRDGFVGAAKKAFESIGLNWVITKHPMDKGETAGLPVSSKTQYELIDDCTVFVSRFATGILEALASGKPVIYFNPHGELVEKYKSPMGAYEIATTSEELAAALRRTLADVEAGVDFRARALPFLQRHTAYAPDGPGVVDRFSAAVREIICETKPKNRIVSQLLLDRLRRDKANEAARIEFLEQEVRLLWDEIGESARDLAASAHAHAANQAAMRSDLELTVERKVQQLERTAEQREQALRDEVLRRLEQTQRKLDALERSSSERHRAAQAEFKLLDEKTQQKVAALEADAVQRHGAICADMDALAKASIQRHEAALAQVKQLAQRTEEKAAAAAAAALEREAAARADVGAQIESAAKATLAQAQKEIAKDRPLVRRLRERVAASERQIGKLRHGDTPNTLVFFGHHKCASRFFRNEVFTTIAEATGSRVRKYQVKDPPFHYSMSDELDLVNIDFSGLGENGRDVILFSNATMRSLEKLNRATSDWRGIRVLRDPRQVLVSDYFHHKGEHRSVSGGWIWDQLAKDKPILQSLPEEEGLLYELESISKQVIETQILAPFDDPRIMTVKIEDFSRDPAGHLQRMSDFLGVADIAGIDFSRTMANPESGPWRRHFTSKLREVFKERYGQVLINLGYAEDLYW